MAGVGGSGGGKMETTVLEQQKIFKKIKYNFTTKIEKEKEKSYMSKSPTTLALSGLTLWRDQPAHSCNAPQTALSKGTQERISMKHRTRCVCLCWCVWTVFVCAHVCVYL